MLTDRRTQTTPATAIDYPPGDRQSTNRFGFGGRRESDEFVVRQGQVITAARNGGDVGTLSSNREKR